MSAHENDTDPDDHVSASDSATTEPDAPLPLARSETPTIPPAMPSRSRLSPSKLASAPPKPPPRRTSSGPMAAAKEPEPPSSRRSARPRPADAGDQLTAGPANSKPPPKQTAESSGEASAVYHGAGTAVPVPLSNVDMRDEPSVILSEPPPPLAKTSRFERDAVQKGLAEVAVRAAAARAAGLPTGRTSMKTVVNADTRVVTRRSMVAVVAGLAVVLFMLGGVWWSRRDDHVRAADTASAWPAAVTPQIPNAVGNVQPGTEAQGMAQPGSAQAAARAPTLAQPASPSPGVQAPSVRGARPLPTTHAQPTVKGRPAHSGDLLEE